MWQGKNHNVAREKTQCGEKSQCGEKNNMARKIHTV